MTINKTKLILEQIDDLDSAKTRSRKSMTPNSVPHLPKIIELTTSQRSTTIGGQSKESPSMNYQIDSSSSVITDGVYAIIKRNRNNKYEILNKGTSEIYVDYKKINKLNTLEDGQIVCFEYPSETTLKPRRTSRPYQHVSKYKVKIVQMEDMVQQTVSDDIVRGSEKILNSSEPSKRNRKSIDKSRPSSSKKSTITETQDKNVNVKSQSFKDHQSLPLLTLRSGNNYRPSLKDESHDQNNQTNLFLEHTKHLNLRSDASTADSNCPKIIKLSGSQSSITIGRSDKSVIDYQIDSSSRLVEIYALIKRQLKSEFVITRKSPNRLYVNRKLIKSSAVLKDGQKICFRCPSKALSNSYEFRIHINQEEEIVRQGGRDNGNTEKLVISKSTSCNDLQNEMMEGDSIQLSTPIDHSKGIGQFKGRCDKATHKNRQSKSTKSEALPPGEPIFEMLDTLVKSATSKTEGSENDVCLQGGMRIDPNSSVLENGSRTNKGLGVKGSVQKSQRVAKMGAKTGMNVRSLTRAASVNNEKPIIPEITTVINSTFEQDATSSGHISAEKENSSTGKIESEASEFVTLPSKQAVVEETVPSKKTNTDGVILSDLSKEINTSQDESRLNIIAEETEEKQNTMPISNGRNYVQSNHSSKQNNNSTGDEIGSRSNFEDPNKAKGEEPFKSEVISYGSKSDSPKIVRTPESLDMNSSPNKRGIERIWMNGKNPGKLMSRKGSGKPSSDAIQLAITDSVSVSRPENGERERRGTKRRMTYFEPTPQPNKVIKVDHQGWECVPHSDTSIFNEKMNADRSDSNDKMRVVTGELAILTESKLNNKGIKKSVLMVNDFHQVDLNELDPNISTANLVKYRELPKMSTQIVANQKVCSELEISSEIVINQQNDLLKYTSKSDEPVMSVPPKINAPGKGNQSNFSVKNNLTQPKLPCGEVSMTISITNDSLCTDRNKVKLEASEVKRDKIEDLQKASFVAVSNPKDSSKVDILSESLGYQEMETSKSGEFVILEPPDIDRSKDVSDISKDNQDNGVNFHKSEALDKLVNKSKVDYISEKARYQEKVLLEVTPETAAKLDDSTTTISSQPVFVISSEIVPSTLSQLNKSKRINLAESTKSDDSVRLVQSKRIGEEVTLPISSNKTYAQEQLATSRNNGGDISKENQLNLINGKLRSRLKNSKASLILTTPKVIKSGQSPIPVVSELENQYSTSKSSNSSDQIDVKGQISLNEDEECTAVKTNPESNITRISKIKEHISKSAAKAISVSNESTCEIPSKPEPQLNSVPSTAHSYFKVPRNGRQDDTEGNIASKPNEGSKDAVEVKVNDLEPMKLRLRPRTSKESKWLILSSIRQPPIVTITKSVSPKSGPASIDMENKSEGGGNPTVNHYCVPKKCAKKTGGKKDDLRRTPGLTAKPSSRSNLNKKLRRQTEPPRNRLRECKNGCQEGNTNDNEEEIFGYYEACDHPRCKRPLKYKEVIRCYTCKRCFHHLCVHAKLREITDPEYTCPDCRNEKAAHLVNEGS